jgi:hypothetical protein
LSIPVDTVLWVKWKIVSFDPLEHGGALTAVKDKA